MSGANVSGARRKVRQARRRWRKVYGGGRKVPGKPFHALRWRLASPERISTWIDGRLALDGYFWLFVLGLNNSGTSMLMRILSTHPLIRPLPTEGQILTRALPQAPDYGVRRNWTTRLDVFRWTERDDPAPALRARYDWAFYYEERPGILLEKSPPNTIRARWLQENFRPSRFIALVRDPYAACEGMRRRDGLSIAEAALHWARGNEILLDDVPHLERCLLLTYEELCTQPEAELDRIERFLELDVPFDRRVLDMPMPLHNVEGVVQTIRNLNAKNVARLSAGDIETIDRIAGPVRERLGYEPVARR